METGLLCFYIIRTTSYSISHVPLFTGFWPLSLYLRLNMPLTFMLLASFILLSCSLHRLTAAYPVNQPYLYNGPRVQLNYTTYVGKKLPNNVSQFLGMRYAAPPTGGLRWRAPRPPRAVNGLRLADKVRLATHKYLCLLVLEAK